jgi:hypothetical protein
MIRPRQASGGRFPEQPSRSVPLASFGATRPRTPDWLRFAASSSIHSQPKGPRFAGRSLTGVVAPESPVPHWVRFALGSHVHKVASKSPSFHWVRFVVAIGFVSSRGSRHHGHLARFVSQLARMSIESLQSSHHSIGFVLSWRMASSRKGTACDRRWSFQRVRAAGGNVSTSPTLGQGAARPPLSIIVADRPIVLAGPRFDGRRLGSASVPELRPQLFPNRPFSPHVLYKTFWFLLTRMENKAILISEWTC